MSPFHLLASQMLHFGPVHLQFVKHHDSNEKLESTRKRMCRSHIQCIDRKRTHWSRKQLDGYIDAMEFEIIKKLYSRSGGQVVLDRIKTFAPLLLVSNPVFVLEFDSAKISPSVNTKVLKRTM